jgi:phospholipid/cholesterol/gamma-HCH transport system ATP-binding protein
MSDSIALHLEGVNLRFGETLVQEGITCSIQPGEIFAIMGPSGCGKSTLMRALLGLHPLKPGDGRILTNDFVFSEAKEGDRSDWLRRFGVLYQSSALWSSLTLGGNIALPLRMHTDYSSEEIDAIVRHKLALVGLEGFADFAPASVSGGMKKRAGLARALALDPKVLFCDEPQAGLDPVTAGRLDQLLMQLRDSLGMSVVLVTHELHSLFTVADRALYLDAQVKRPTALGDPRELRDDPPNEAIRAFLRREG